jgi:hypothetical protein
MRRKEMRTYAHYCADGTIGGLVVAEASDCAELRMRPEPNMFFDEVKGLSIGDPKDIAAARKIIQKHRVKVSRAPAVLIKNT